MQNRTKGIVALTISAFGFALMALFVRWCDDCGSPISSFQKSFFRNVIALLIAAVAFLHQGTVHFPKLQFSWVGLLGLRALLGTIGIFANFYALSHITIAEGQTLNKTAPFFTVVFAWIFLGEKASRRQLMTLLFAFLGVVFIVKPGWVSEASFPLAMGLVGGVAAGGAYACVRVLRMREVPPSLIILVFSAFSCLASVPFMMVHFDSMTLQQVFMLFGAGASAALGQFGITWAYGYAAPREIAVWDYSNIVFTALLGFIFLGQVPDLWSILGGSIIVFAYCKAQRSSLSA